MHNGASQYTDTCKCGLAEEIFGRLLVAASSQHRSQMFWMTAWCQMRRSNPARLASVALPNVGRALQRCCVQSVAVLLRAAVDVIMPEYAG